MTTMTQCRLRNGAGGMTDAWIESRGAVVGQWVEVKGLDELYEVIETHSELPAEVVYENERNFKSHRKATDV